MTQRWRWWWLPGHPPLHVHEHYTGDARRFSSVHSLHHLLLPVAPYWWDSTRFHTFQKASGWTGATSASWHLQSETVSTLKLMKNHMWQLTIFSSRWWWWWWWNSYHVGSFLHNLRTTAGSTRRLINQEDLSLFFRFYLKMMFREESVKVQERKKEVYECLLLRVEHLSTQINCFSTWMRHWRTCQLLFILQIVIIKRKLHHQLETCHSRQEVSAWCKNHRRDTFTVFRTEKMYWLKVFIEVWRTKTPKISSK